MTPRVVAIVPAAGQGKRLGLKTKKPFVMLGGRPIISRTIEKLDGSKYITAIIIATERSSIARMKRLVKACGFRKVRSVVAGGKTRFESVRNCLGYVGESFDIVLIHDAARPFVDDSIIAASVEGAVKYGGAIAAVPESDTLKLAKSDNMIKATIDRTKVFRAQTPQTFRTDIIKSAYARSSGRGVTDDASLVEKAGGRVRIVPGSYRNIKITTSDDLRIAEVLLHG